MMFNHLSSSVSSQAFNPRDALSFPKHALSQSVRHAQTLAPGQFTGVLQSCSSTTMAATSKYLSGLTWSIDHTVCL
jgi:hypothetical protein